MFFIEDVSLWMYGLAFLVVVIGSAYAYHKLIPQGHGIVAAGELTFWDAIYFSLVTVSSLGYGDIHPVGLSRCIACAEVLFGLFTMGIIIAKATSFRLAYHVQRLFSGSIQERVQRFSQDFERLNDDIKTVSQLISKAFDVPGTKNRQEKQDQAAEGFSRAADLLHMHCSGVAEYIVVELDYGRFFEMAEARSMQRMVNAMDDVFARLGVMISTMSPSSREKLVLDRNNRDRILKAMDSQGTLHAIVSEHCADGPVRDGFMRLQQTCKAVPQGYFAVPVLPANQPVLEPPTDEPQTEAV